MIVEADADADSDCSSEIKATADANPNFIHPSADVHPNAIIGHVNNLISEADNSATVFFFFLLLF